MARRYQTAAPLVPESGDLETLRRAATGCTACPLHETGTQTVFGEGPQDAKVMVVGEQPGDREDVEGHPFVGPAGRLLDEVLAEAGIDRRAVYVTNAVKHFKWEPRGKRRLHKKPNAGEIAACHPWLEAEIAAVKPGLVVALGATAAQALLGKDFRLTRHHGEVFPLNGNGPFAAATLHPSAVLRTPAPEAREIRREQLVADLRHAAQWLDTAP